MFNQNFCKEKKKEIISSVSEKFSFKWSQILTVCWETTQNLRLMFSLFRYRNDIHWKRKGVQTLYIKFWVFSTYSNSRSF